MLVSWCPYFVHMNEVILHQKILFPTTKREKLNNLNHDTWQSKIQYIQIEQEVLQNVTNSLEKSLNGDTKQHIVILRHIKRY